MPSSHAHASLGRRSGRRLITLATALALAAASALVTLPAHADPGVAPQAGAFTLRGAGFGHGRGMSQYGAYGAARQGLTWPRILSFYYPGTTQAKQGSGATIKVWITADSDNDLRVMPSAGLRLRSGSRTYPLPAGRSYTAWRVTRSGAGFALSYRSTANRWVRHAAPLPATSTWWFENSAKLITVWARGGVRRELRGSVALVKRGTGGRTVNHLSVEDYVRGVVPAEMPTSWAAHAVAAQAVAARSYGVRLQAFSRASGYDVCDTTSCQVYRGYAAKVRSGPRTVYETRRGNDAVRATARVILRYGNAVALTEFGSSNGGSTARSSLPYQRAKLDPYDRLVSSNDYRRTITAAGVARQWPSVGTVRQLKVTARSGPGRWGGRVQTLQIIGSKRTLTVSGSAFASRYGLRSSLYTFAATG